MHNLCFEQKYEKYQSFLSKNFQFLEVKFSIYLNRCVFVMRTGAQTRTRNGFISLDLEKETYFKALRKHAYLNILKILPPKNKKNSEKKILIFFIFLLQT